VPRVATEGRRDGRGRDPLARHASLDAVVRHQEVDTLLVEGALDFAVFAMDATGRVVSWNVGAQHLTGHLPEEVVGSNYRFLWVPEDLAAGKDVQELATAARLGRAESETWVLRKDGSRFWATCVSRRLLGPQGDLQGFVKVMRDDSARHAAEQEARLAHDELRRFQQMVSHELRNQLSPMRMQLHLLRNDAPPPVRERALSGLGRALERVERLAQDLSDASRMQVFEFQVAFTQVELGELVTQAQDGMADLARHGGVLLEVSCEEGLRVHGDAERLAQVLQNLLGNAIKYTPPGRRVLLQASRDGEHVLLCVQDEGVGLTPEQVAQLFEPFARPHKDRPGVGLGLYLSRTIVERHGGRIWAASDGPGRGSRFCVRLPVQQARPRSGGGSA